MYWAARRRLGILLLLAGVAGVLASGAAYVAWYAPPSCTDTVQNQDEAGIDCGGSCPYVCAAEVLEPRARFAVLLRAPNERTDFAALVENRNNDLAARAAPFVITLYGSTGTLIKQLHGSIDLPPRTSVPLFVPGVEVGAVQAARAFIEIDMARARWYRLTQDPRPVPLVTVRPVDPTRALPRVVADLSNPSLVPLARLPVVALVRDTTTGIVVAASQTIVPRLEPQGSAEALFTWNTAFPAASVRVEVLPVVPLP